MEYDKSFTGDGLNLKKHPSSKKLLPYVLGSWTRVNGNKAINSIIQTTNIVLLLLLLLANGIKNAIEMKGWSERNISYICKTKRKAFIYADFFLFPKLLEY